MSDDPTTKKDPETGNVFEVDLAPVTADEAEYRELCQVYDEARQKKLTVRSSPRLGSTSPLTAQRKIDLTIIPPLVLIYLLSYIDRSNVGNVRL